MQWDHDTFLLVGFNLSRYVLPKKLPDLMPETCARLWNIKVQEMRIVKDTEELWAVPMAVAHNTSLALLLHSQGDKGSQDQAPDPSCRATRAAS